MILSRKGNKVGQNAQGRKKKNFQQIFAIPCFSLTKKRRYCVVTIQVIDGREAEMGFDWVLFLLRPRDGRDVRGTEVALVQYMEVTPHLGEVGRTLRCICVRISSSDE